MRHLLLVLALTMGLTACREEADLGDLPKAEAISICEGEVHEALPRAEIVASTAEKGDRYWRVVGHSDPNGVFTCVISAVDGEVLTTSFGRA